MRSFVRDCYSFCRFDVLAAEPPPACGEREPPGGGAWHQQQDCQQQKAEEFVAAVLADELQPAAPTSGAEGQPAAGAAAEEGSGRSADGTGGVSSAPECGTAVGAAIWALHPCSQASLEQPPALLAIPGADERTAEVACATCGQRVAEFQEQAAGRKLGMLMAVQLYCCGGAPQAAATPPATSATDGQPAAQSADAAAEDRQGAMGSVSAEPAHVSPSWAAHPAAPLPTLPRICLAAGYEDGSVAIWEVGAARGVPPLALRQLCSEPVMALAVDGSGAGGACGSAEEQVVVFKIDHAARRLSVRHTIELRGKGKAGVGDVAVRPDRRLLATAGWDGRVRLYKYRSGRPLAVLKVGEWGRVDGAPGWDAALNRELEMAVHGETVVCFVVQEAAECGHVMGGFPPRGTHPTKWFAWPPGLTHHQEGAHPTKCFCLALYAHPPAFCLLSCPAALQYHSSSPVTGLRFAPRSMLLASAARDGTLALWNLYTPEEAG